MHAKDVSVAKYQYHDTTVNTVKSIRYVCLIIILADE